MIILNSYNIDNNTVRFSNGGYQGKSVNTVAGEKNCQYYKKSDIILISNLSEINLPQLRLVIWSNNPLLIQ